MVAGTVGHAPLWDSNARGPSDHCIVRNRASRAGAGTGRRGPWLDVGGGQRSGAGPPSQSGRRGHSSPVPCRRSPVARRGPARRQLSVVWELEVGHTVTPAQGLPDRIYPESFDDPATLAGFVDAMRWGAVTSADPNRYQAPFWSGVNVEAYQLEPLRRRSAHPRTNLLLADDVGLGKTIEAGLVIQELLLRHRARTAVIVCPPSLSLKWQDEMRDKFGLEFTIVNSELMAEVRRTPRAARQPVPACSRGSSCRWRGCRRFGRSGCCATCTRRRATRSRASGSRSTSSWSTRPTTSPRPAHRRLQADAATPSTHSAPSPCASSPTSASTASSSRPRRTTGTRSRSPRSWR